MGQRSQIYVRIEAKDGKKELFARYFDWNYGERMMSRARHTVEWLLNQNYESTIRDKIARIVDVNFDMQDIVKSSDIIKEYADDIEIWNCTLNEFFYGQDNNNGVLFVDVIQDTVKYAFLDWEYKYLGDGIAYMQEDRKDWLTTPDDYHDQEDIDICKANIEFLQEKATLMSAEECDAFLQCNYNWQLDAYCNKTAKAILISTCEREILVETFCSIREAQNQMSQEFYSVILEEGKDADDLIDENEAAINFDNAFINDLKGNNYDWKITPIN